jgi:trehalose synthase
MRTMMRLVEPERATSLDDYEAVVHLSAAVRDLRREGLRLTPALAGRRVWMVNSAAQGGGVAELLPPLLALLRELGVDARWLVMETEEPEFFRLTKRLHNLIHGRGDSAISSAERALYARVSRAMAQAIAPHLAAGDVLVVHDPQPLGAGAVLRETMDVIAIWRCHIGLDRETPQTRAAWAFLADYVAPYDRAIFTAPEYIPRCLAGRASIIHPGIDPLSHKNRMLPIHKLVGVLANGALTKPYGPVLTPAFPDVAQRFQANGIWRPATEPEDLGLLFRPIVSQVSRWDRLKGFLPLMEGFAVLKHDLGNGADLEPRYRRTLELARLVLAGPEPASIQDDPEGREVLAEIATAYRRLPPSLQSDVAIISLPMRSAKNNALLVNALQRCSDVVAAGLRQQIRPGLDGCLVENPEDPAELARVLGELLRDRRKREALGRSGQQRVHDDFLIFSQVRRWLEVIAETAAGRATPLRPGSTSTLRSDSQQRA